MTLKKVLSCFHATLESLWATVSEVEAVLTNQPLTHASPDVDDDGPTTPAHLLYGRPINSLPHYNVPED